MKVSICTDSQVGCTFIYIGIHTVVTILSTVDREIFMFKTIRVKIFCGVKFLRFRSIHEIF